MSSNYPPGVTGNEPQISGIYPPDTVIDGVTATLESYADVFEDEAAYLDEQGLLSGHHSDRFDFIVKHIRDLSEELSSMIPDDRYDYDDGDYGEENS